MTAGMAKFSDDSLPTNRKMREMGEREKQLMEDQEFEDFSDPPAVSQFTKDEWYKDHNKEFVYSPGLVDDFRYQDGINVGPVADWGEWAMPAASKDGRQKDPPTWFTGGYAWIERFNRQHDNVSAKDNDSDHGHISVDLSSINIHYGFKNASGDMTDYTMRVNRTTGRFVEDFTSPIVSDHTSGTCMIFK